LLGVPFVERVVERRAPELTTVFLCHRFDVDVPAPDVAACIGTKEFVATLPQWLHLRSPDKDTVLYPGVAYPSYEMGAILAGCRAVPIDVTRHSFTIGLQTTGQSCSIIGRWHKP